MFSVKLVDRMRCPRCNSERIRCDYNDAGVVLRLIRLRKLLCDKCGLVFKGHPLLTPISKALFRARWVRHKI